MSLQLQAELEPIFSGAQTGPTARWAAANWINRVLLVSQSVQPIYYEPGLTEVPVWGKCRPVPGLPDQTGYDGIEVFAGHVLLWRGETIKGSDLNDFAQWIPAAASASVGRATLSDDFIQPATGATSSPVYLEGVSGSFAEGQFVRIVSDESDPSRIAYSYYTVASTSVGGSVAAISATMGVPAASKSRVYLTERVDWAAGSRVAVNGDVTSAEVEVVSRDDDSSHALLDASSQVPAVGGTIQFPLDAPVNGFRAGDVVSVSESASVGQDLYEVVSSGQTLVCRRLGVGEDQASVGTTYDAGSYVTAQPYVVLVNRTNSSVSIPGDARLAPSPELRLVSLGYSGAVPAGSTVRAGATVETIGVNEATEIQNVGSGINGDIYAIVALADYAYILKRESIQSMQYVGGSSPYTIRAEIFDEGPIGRYAWCRFENKAIVFWGRKGWYKYVGGQVLEPTGVAHWDAANAELDVARADEIVAFHHRAASEVWFAFPTLSGTTKVAIYNYDSDSVVVDEYPEDLNGITALGEVEWEIAPTWESLPATERFNCEVYGPGVSQGSVPDQAPKRWYEYVEDGLRPRVLIGIGGTDGNIDNGENPAATVPRILAHGRVWHRTASDDCDPQAYTAFAETPDFDFGDPQVVKYVEMVYLHLHVPEDLSRPMKLKVQLGVRAGLDAAIIWSAAVPVEVSGNGNIVTKVDVRGAGRLARLRFISDETDVRWEISQYQIVARAGGLY